MQVEELFDLTNWIQREIVDANIVQKYNQLHKILSHNAQPNQQKQPFEQQQEELITTLNKVPLSELSLGQIEILSTIGIAKNVGEEGAENIKDVLFRNALDIANAVEKVQLSIQKINEGIQWAQQIRDLLSKIIHDEEVLELGESVLLRVHFQKDADLSNLTEFKDWGKTWYDIGRGISMAHGKAPEDISVVGASKGSIVISLLTVYGIAKTTSFIIMEALKVAEKVLDIRRKAEEIKAMKLSNDKAEKALIDDAKNAKKIGIEDIIKNTTKELKLNAGNEGDKVQALESAVKKLVDFVEKGGEVDFVLPDEEDVDEEEGEAEVDANRRQREELRAMFNEVRQLEQKIHQIEYQASNDDE